jgi:nucleotide-binding universal stress UspA family protein
MTVAVVYAMTSTSRRALLEAVAEAQRRDQNLAVLHVAGSPDAQSTVYRDSIAEEIGKAIASTGDVDWSLHLRQAASDAEVNDALLGLIRSVDADVVVVGARRRSPIGKALLGSTAQSVVLGADSPVLVVKGTA